MKGLWLAVVIGSLMYLCSCTPDGRLRLPDVFSPSGKEERTEEVAGGMEAIEAPYYIPAETIRDAVIDLLRARSIPYREQQEDGTIETDPVVPNRVKGWGQKMSEGDCETVFRVQINRISQGKTQLSVKVLFPLCKLNQAKSCEKLARLLKDRFLDEVHEALAGGKTRPTQEKQPGAEPGKIMAIAVRAANIRSNPSTKSKAITRLGYGSRVAVLGQKGEWVQVEMESGQEGWIHGSLLEDVVSEDAGGEEESRPETVEREELRPTADSTKPRAKSEKSTVLSPPAAEIPAKAGDATSPPQEGEMQEERITDLEDTGKGEASPGQEAALKADPTEKGTAQAVDSPPATTQAETPPPPPPPPEPVLVVREGPAVDVFRDPNVFSPKIGKIEGGARIAAFEKKGNFFKVSHRGLEGYIYKDFCKIQEQTERYRTETPQ
jgi:hypothetical protein